MKGLRVVSVSSVAGSVWIGHAANVAPNRARHWELEGRWRAVPCEKGEAGCGCKFGAYGMLMEEMR